VAALQRRVRDLSIGTLAAERVLVTCESQFVITEHVFGPAVEALNLTREPLWRTYRVAVPQLAGRLRIDQRSDLVQIGMIVLALVAGRPIADDEFPAPVSRLVADLFGGLPPDGFDATAFAELKSWLVRALQIDPRRSFRTAADLETALGQWVPVDRLPADVAAALRSGLSSVPVPAAWSPVPLAGPSSAGGPFSAAAGSPVADVRSQQVPSLSTQPAERTGLPLDAAPPWSPLAESLNSMASGEASHTGGGGGPDAEQQARQRARGVGLAAFGRWLPRIGWLLAGAALIAIAVCAIRWRSQPPVGDGTLIIDSQPPGAEVRIDDQPVGRTRLETTVRGGPRSVALRHGERRRVIPVVAAPDERLTVTFELRDLREMGQLEVRSDPTGAEVSINGRPQGETPLLLDIRAGTHVVRVRQGKTTVQHPVTVRPGRIASLLVSLTAARARQNAQDRPPSPMSAPER
jgi:hypothetical protein